MIVKNKVTNTYPSIIHSPDEYSKLWLNILEYFKTVKPKSTKSNNEVTIISWCNKKDNILKKTSSALGEQVTFYGQSDKEWYNLNKFKYNLEALKTFNTPYFIGLDALDVAMIGRSNFIVKKFKSLSCSLLFNCESVFYPPFYKYPYYLEHKNFQDSVGNGKFKYLNSGAWIGEREFCIEFFNECSKLNIDDFLDCGNLTKLRNCDQSLVHYVFKKYYPKVQLDYNNNIFSNISNSNDDFLINDGIKIL